jgi:hypothetical protein
MLNNEEITTLAQDALDAAARLIQDRIGVETGDFAGVFFSNGKMEEILQEYIREELHTIEWNKVKPTNHLSNC